jgi:hypothetical protein
VRNHHPLEFSMTRRLISTLGVTLAIGACGSTTPDTNGSPPEEAGLPVSAVADRATDRVESSATTSAPTGSTSVALSNTPPGPSAAPPAGSSLPDYQEVVIPNGTELLMSLTTAIGSDTSVVEDAVSAELTQAITVDGREVIPAGAQMEGSVTGVDGGGRVTGRATITFRFALIRLGEEQYEMQVAPVSQMAPATKGEDATQIGVAAGAGALIGGLLGGADGAAKGAAVGGGAGAVLATRGAEVRLESGAAVITELTFPLTVRVSAD